MRSANMKWIWDVLEVSKWKSISTIQNREFKNITHFHMRQENRSEKFSIKCWNLTFYENVPSLQILLVTC